MPSLKVIRLTRPLASGRSWLEDGIVQTDPLGGFALLPASFAPVYCGEAFRVFCSFDAKDATKVSFEAVLHAPSGKVVLIPYGESEEPVEEFGRIISTELTNAGNYQLQVTVRYVLHGQAEEIRKLYRFAATRAFNVRTKIQTSGSNMFVESQIENLTHENLLVKRAQLVHEDELSPMDSLNPVEKVLMSHDVFQWVFCIPARERVGRLKIQWQSLSGESGNIMTGPLKAR